MDITGKLKLKEAEQQVSEKFKKREFVIITEDQYPQHILIQLTQDRCGLIDAFNVGDSIKVHINIRGREWNDTKNGTVKHFNSIECWKIEKVGGTTASTTTAPGGDLPF